MRINWSGAWNTVTVILIATINAKHISCIISSNLADQSTWRFFKKIYIYLAALGLICGLLDLQSSLQHAGNLVVTCRI